MFTSKSHIPNLWEDPNLKFSDIKNILSLACEGKLEKATEKFDGQFLAVSWNGNSLRLARNKGDLKQEGLEVSHFISKYKINEKVSKSYSDCASVLTEFFKSSNPKAKNHWFAVEILDKGNPNIIQYSENAIIFHNDNSEALTVLSESVKDINGWKLRAPVFIEQRGCSEAEAHKANLRLKKILEINNLIENNTVQDLMNRSLKKENIKNKLFPLEVLISDFGVSLLKNHSSFLVENPTGEKDRIMAELKALTQKHNSNPSLKSNLSKIKNNDNVVPIEGIVFEYKNNLYKFNGYFGAINKIFWMDKKPSAQMATQEEKTLRESVKYLIGAMGKL